MEMFIDILLDAAIDCVKMLPFLFLAFLLIEALEHYSSDFTKKLIDRPAILPYHFAKRFLRRIG